MVARITWGQNGALLRAYIVAYCILFVGHVYYRVCGVCTNRGGVAYGKSIIGAYVPICNFCHLPYCRAVMPTVY
jgi:hypothetical protein